MRKITTIISAMMFSGLIASAGNLPLGQSFSYNNSVVDGSKVSNAYSVALKWDEEVQFVDDDPLQAYFTLQWNDNAPERFENEEYATYYSYITLGNPYAYPLAMSSDFVVFSIYATQAGNYVLTVPAGILQNEDGDLNQEQKISFQVVETLSTYSDDFKVTPPQSTSAYNYETQETTPPPFYTSAQLNNITVGWTGVTLSPSGNGEVTLINVEDYDNEQNINDLVSVANGVINIDLSSMTDGTYNLTIPSGYVEGEDAANNSYVNGTVYLTYIILDNPESLDDVEMTYPTDKYLNYFRYADFSFDSPIRFTDTEKAVTLKSDKAEYVLNTSINENSGEFVLRVSPASGYIEAAGVYTLTVPAGIVTNGKYENPEIVKTITILEYDENYQAVPADHTTVTTQQLSKITVTFPNATTLKQNVEGWKDFTLTTINYGVGREESSLKFGEEVVISGNTIEIYIPNIQQLEYEIKIPAFDFFIDNDKTNSQIYLYYTAWNGMPQPTVLCGPLADTDETQNTTTNVIVELTWDYQAITATDNFGVELGYGYYKNPLEVPSSCLSLIKVNNPNGGTAAGNNALSIDLSSVIEDYFENFNPSWAQTFYLTIPAGVVKNAEGLENPVTTIQFTPYPVIDTEFVCEETEESGIYAIYYEDVTWMSTYFTKNLTLTGKDIDEIVLKPTASYDATLPAPGEFLAGYLDPDNYTGRCVLVNLNLDLSTGLYQLNIPEGFFTVSLDGRDMDCINEAFSVDINLMASGVNSVEEKFEGFKVYNLQGVNVLNTTNISDLNNLAKGIYIVNGKKVFVGK